jgi:hypothetical protein
MSKRITAIPANEHLQPAQEQTWRHQWDERGKPDTEMFARKAGVGPVATT